MSYDVGIGSESFNYTYNLAELFYDHIPASENGRGGIHELDGLTGKQATEVLANAFSQIIDTYRDCRSGASEFSAKYDAPNGWGSTIGALLFLASIMAACARNPRKRVVVC